MLLKFSEKHLKSEWLTNSNEQYIENTTVVINLGMEKATIAAIPEKHLYPRESTLLRGVDIRGGDSLLLIEIIKESDIGGVVLEPGWHQLGEIIDYPRDVPLWRSAQYELGTVRFDPYYVTRSSPHPFENKFKEFQVKVNLWFAPAKTNCLIHKRHAETEILEIHTQIYGTGRMQKFHTDNYPSLYEETTMSPGNSHQPFASTDGEGTFIYPWHQYYADTDCIWIANEFHPV